MVDIGVSHNDPSLQQSVLGRNDSAMLKYFVIQEDLMTNGNDNVNDVNSPVQTQESEVGDAELQVGTSRIDSGERSDESSTNVSASFSCEECGKKFGTRQELKEHTQAH